MTLFIDLTPDWESVRAFVLSMARTDLVAASGIAATMGCETPKEFRRAIITKRGTSLETVQAYLPANYRAYYCHGGIGIEGFDSNGWTLDGYVIPRLASGLHFAVEVKSLPAKKETT
jgi:hypothetical protein